MASAIKIGRKWVWKWSMLIAVQAGEKSTSIAYWPGHINNAITMQSAFDRPLFIPPPWDANPEFRITWLPTKYPSFEVRHSLPKIYGYWYESHFMTVLNPSYKLSSTLQSVGFPNPIMKMILSKFIPSKKCTPSNEFIWVLWCYCIVH